MMPNPRLRRRVAAGLCLAAASLAHAAPLTRQPARTADAAALPAALTSELIFSNFGKPPAMFDLTGLQIIGPVNADGVGRQFVAVPFVPRQDVSMTGIALPVTREPGIGTQLGIRVSLLADAAGLPGATVASWPVRTVADLVPGNYSYVGVSLPRRGGIALSAGSTYWIAVDTDPGSDFYGAWGSNAANADGTLAYWNDYTGGGWKVMSFTLPALAVYGVRR